ncbi:MAG: chlamydia virulence plasmid protein pGP8-D [Parachlamydiales bacterium]|nr:chlamydia virulence plasmid protein pGP8-D [Parachlamydiales bacterium]
MGLLQTHTSSSTMIQAVVSRDEAIWKELSKISLVDASNRFLESLSGNTQRAYRAAFNSIFHLLETQRLFDPRNNLQTFALSNLEYLLDEIRSKLVGSDSTKQARAAAFIALTRFLQRSTGGLIRKVVPRKEKSNPTFRQVRETSLTKALNRVQWTRFLTFLQRSSYRDYLVAKTILQGAKRVGEVLCAQISQIDWALNQITFRQFKSKTLEKYTVITYPAAFIQELKEYIGERKEGFIFTTRNGKPLTQPHLYRSFANAGLQAGIPFTVHPHVLRASAITYLTTQGYSADQILRVSGHADTKLVRYYDKTPIEQNPSQDISLI